MSDITGRNSRRRTLGRSRPNYDTARWEDAGPLIPGTAKEFVRRATERSSGREGVVKHLPSRSSRRRERRFYDEAVNMHRMNDTPGILPVWDIDDTLPG